MAGSGVYRLRLARAGGGTNPRQKNSVRKGNDVTVNVNVGSGLAPKKSSTLVTRQVPKKVLPPASNEQPSRGEHGRNTSNTTKRNDSSR